MKKRAFSIAEILVASAIFLGLAGCLIALYRMGLKARTRHEAHQRPHRAALQCISYLRNELRLVQLLEPSSFTGPPASFIRYRRTAFDGPVHFDGSGTPQWTQICQLSYEPDQQLWRRSEDPNVKPRALVRLGPGGHVLFKRINDQLLQVDIRTDFGDPKAAVQMEQKFLLPNQP